MNFLLSLMVLEIAEISVSVPSIPEACPCLNVGQPSFRMPPYAIHSYSVVKNIGQGILQVHTSHRRLSSFFYFSILASKNIF